MRNFTAILFAFFLSLFANPSFAQTPTNQAPANAVCKTGSDADLPVIKIKVANMASRLKRLKQAKQTTRSRVAKLRTEILSIDQVLTPWRTRHKSAAERAGKTESTYAVYKSNWIDTGELNKLNAKIRLRKLKHADYKRLRTQYKNENAEFEALGAKYQHIARDLLDQDRDCAGAMAALR